MTAETANTILGLDEGATLFKGPMAFCSAAKLTHPDTGGKAADYASMTEE